MTEGQEELVPGASIPTRLLTGDEERAYVHHLVRVIRAARLNEYGGTTPPTAQGGPAGVNATDAHGVSTGLW